MPPVSGWLRLSLVAGFTLVTAACSEGAAGEAQARALAKGSACPSAEDMTTAMGAPVTFTQSVGGFCMYELTGRYRGVFIELTTQPASRADDVYAHLGQVVKGIKGQEATLDRVDLPGLEALDRGPHRRGRERPLQSGAVGTARGSGEGRAHGWVPDHAGPAHDHRLRGVATAGSERHGRRPSAEPPGGAHTTMSRIGAHVEVSVKVSGAEPPGGGIHGPQASL